MNTLSGKGMSKNKRFVPLRAYFCPVTRVWLPHFVQIWNCWNLILVVDLERLWAIIWLSSFEQFFFGLARHLRQAGFEFFLLPSRVHARRSLAGMLGC
jgi:hypothetical protein